MAVLVSGGAGYIGSFVVRALLNRGKQPVIVDNLATGHQEAVPAGVPLVPVSCGETELLADLMVRHRVDEAIHLSAFSLVGESVRDPGKYWRNNVGSTAGMLEACRMAGVQRFVFSSSAATYGEPESVPITEDHPLRPTNPYGTTKVAVEWMLDHHRSAHGLGWVALRYFNAAGASPDGSCGEDHDPESHLIPLALAAAAGSGRPLTVFGADWATPDGTCVRDYIHVLDLAEAHLQALDWLERKPGQGAVFNLGTGSGSSVRQILDMVAKIVGRPVPHVTGPRRAGDPAVLVASNERALSELGWRPERDLEAVVRDAWAWHRSHPAGY